MRKFELDLQRREKQLTDLILKNERGDERGLTSHYFLNGEDTGLLSNFSKAEALSDTHKSNRSISARHLSWTTYGQNIDHILQQF